MAGEGDNVIVPLYSDMLSGEYIGHVKAVAGSVREAHICKDTVHLLLLLMKVVIGNDKLLVGEVLNKGKKLVFYHPQRLYSLIVILLGNHDASFAYQVRGTTFRILVDGD